MLNFLTSTVFPIRTDVAMHKFRLVNPMQCRSKVWSSDNWSLFGVGVDRKLILQQILKKGDGRAYAALIWLRIGDSGGLLWIR